MLGLLQNVQTGSGDTPSLLFGGYRVCFPVGNDAATQSSAEIEINLFFRTCLHCVHSNRPLPLQGGGNMRLSTDSTQRTVM